MQFSSVPRKRTMNQELTSTYIVAARNLSFCLPDTFFLLPCRKYTQSFCQDKNPKNQPVITTNSISKISGRPVNAPSGLDVVPLVLRIYKIRRQIVPPSTHIHPIYKWNTKQSHSHSSTHTHTRAHKQWRHFLRGTPLSFFSDRCLHLLELPLCHYSP